VVGGGGGGGGVCACVAGEIDLAIGGDLNNLRYYVGIRMIEKVTHEARDGLRRESRSNPIVGEVDWPWCACTD